MKIAIYFSEKLILFLFRLCNVGSPHPSAAIMTTLLWRLKQKPHWGAGGPRGALPLIHLMASSRTAILTMAVGVKNSPPFHTADQPTQERKNL